MEGFVPFPANVININGSAITPSFHTLKSNIRLFVFCCLSLVQWILAIEINSLKTNKWCTCRVCECYYCHILGHRLFIERFRVARALALISVNNYCYMLVCVLGTYYYFYFYFFTVCYQQGTDAFILLQFYIMILGAECGYLPLQNKFITFNYLSSPHPLMQ